MARILELLAFFLGAAGACGIVWTAFGWPAVAGAAALLTGVRYVADRPRGGVLKWLPALALIGFHAACAYLALVFGWLLGWSVPWSIQGTLAAIAVLAVTGWIRPRATLRLPILFPLGLWISICTLGWWREDGVIRCDDYIRFQSDQSIRLAIPSTTALGACAPGQLLRLQRYPRRVWESPDGSRYIVTTQEGVKAFTHGEPVADPIEASVCEFGADGSRRSCIGSRNYKMQVIFDAERLDQVIVGGWGGSRDGADGVLYALPRSGPLRLIAEAHTNGHTGEGYYDPDADEIGLLADECTGLTRLRASNLSPLPHVPAPFCPGEAHYDPISHDGIFCFAPGPLAPLLDVGTAGFLSVAFRSNPFSARVIGTASGDLWTYAAMVWGCDFDPVQRVAWVPAASLPVTAVIDYDNGRITDTFWSEPGARSVAFDAQRRRLYIANFLRGDVVAVDVDSGAHVARWFVGRFARYVALSRDRSSILATSNLGVVRIPLSPPVVPAERGT